MRVYDTFPFRRWDRWLDDTRTHLFVVRADGESAASARDLLAGTALASDRASGPPRAKARPTTSHPSSLPTDARSCSSPPPIGPRPPTPRSARTSSRWPGGRRAGRADERPGEPRPAALRARGRSLCYLVTEDWERLYALDRLACAAWPVAANAKARALTRDFDRSVGDFALGPDGRADLTAEDEGFVRLYSVPVDGGAVTPVVEDARSFAGLDLPGLARPATWSRAGAAPSEPARHRPLTRGRTAALDADRRSTVEAAGGSSGRPCRSSGSRIDTGRRLHSFLALPQGFDPRRSIRSRPDPRRPRRHVARLDHAPLELPPAGAARLRGAAHRLRRLHRLRRAIHARHPGDPLRGPRRRHQPRRGRGDQRFPFIDGSRRPPAAPATAGTWRTGSRPRPPATSAWSATPGWPASRPSGRPATRSTTAN